MIREMRCQELDISRCPAISRYRDFSIHGQHKGSCWVIVLAYSRLARETGHLQVLPEHFRKFRFLGVRGPRFYRRIRRIIRPIENEFV